MLLEYNGLLPFLEDRSFFVKPKIQSNTVLVFFPNNNFYLYATNRLIFNLLSIIFAIFKNETLYELNVAILLTKLEKDLSGI